MTGRAAMVRALEALEDGPSRPLRYRCECGSAFEWPGLLEAHRYRCTWRAVA
jgi:hypothetical protein